MGLLDGLEKEAWHTIDLGVPDTEATAARPLYAQIQGQLLVLRRLRFSGHPLRLQSKIRLRLLLRYLYSLERVLKRVNNPLVLVRRVHGHHLPVVLGGCSAGVAVVQVHEYRRSSDALQGWHAAGRRGGDAGRGKGFRGCVGGSWSTHRDPAQWGQGVLPRWGQ